VRDVGAHLTFAQTPVRDHGVPKALIEIVTLGRTLRERAADVLAYSDRPGTSNGPTEAINSAR
jgi:transposase